MKTRISTTASAVLLVASIFSAPVFALCNTDLLAWHTSIVIRIDCGTAVIKTATLFANGSVSDTVTLASPFKSTVYIQKPLPAVTTTYSAKATTATATIAAGKGMTIMVPPTPEIVPVCTLMASPNPINPGSATKLNMQCAPAAHTYDLTSGQSCDATLGCPWFKPTATTTYSMAGVSATGLRSAVQNVTVTVNQPAPPPPDPVTGLPPFPWTVRGIVYQNTQEWNDGVATRRFGDSCVAINGKQVHGGFGPCIQGTSP